ncbi:hypothetical protein IWW57_004913 [Coemansia sp. S610]|uniref:Uncharacterized protein n=1 Tax=Coemansia linderi TaxID=2663919 RepID=A0ACC1KJQ9_9FUNG|nr:hypothetical protein IWW57_004913 [Coemansia sp. S610]KAJ2417081.1 hypothetical protein GGI10_000475 [Coemansia sp. RSA 2530]KAJ2697625.1 hypothetical protein H4218_003834 [Coemansia sp. IMI 209128]KAJ2790534.1 hypothetical protein GGI18_001740 [Coemansia linderi]
MTATLDIDALWVGAPFAPVFSPNMHPVLALVFASVGLVYAGKFAVTRADLKREVMFAGVASAALGLAVVLGIQALGLYL